MTQHIFLDKSKKPNDAMLFKVLGETYNYWLEIKTTLEIQYGPLTVDWKFYGAASGWTMKLLLKKRNLFFLSAREQYFVITFIFGDKAVAAVQKSTLPKKIVHDLINAKRYMEGRGVRIDVKKKTMIKHIVTLANIKVEH